MDESAHSKCIYIQEETMKRVLSVWQPASALGHRTMRKNKQKTQKRCRNVASCAVGVGATNAHTSPNLSSHRNGAHSHRHSHGVHIDPSAAAAGGGAWWYTIAAVAVAVNPPIRAHAKRATQNGW